MTRTTLLTVLASLGLAAAMLLLVPSWVTAQTPPAASPRAGLDVAKKHMERGQELYMQGKWKEAAAAFAEAYKSQPYAAFLYNEAVCHQKLGDNELALSLFQRYLAADPNAPDADKVRGRIERLQAALAPAGAPAADAGPDAEPTQPPPAAEPGKVVKEEGPDLMKSLVIIESEPAAAPVSIFLPTSPSVPPFQLGKENPGWSRVAAGSTPMNATLPVGRYHVVIDRFADFQASETDIDVAAGRVHQFKANLSQGEFLAFLRVTSPVRGARIYIDDPPPHRKPPWGTTPHEGLIGLGQHRVWVARAGFKTSSRQFSVSHGEEREELVDLERIDSGTLSIEGNAASISVEIDGRSVGVFRAGEPIVIELPAGKHSINASTEDRKNLEAEVNVPKGQILPVDLVMMPTTPRGAAWTQGIVSAALLGGGVVLGLRADSVYDNLQTDQRAGILTESDDRYVKGKIYAISSTVCFGLSGVFAGLSTYNFIKDPTPDSGLRTGQPRDYPEEGDAPASPPPRRAPSSIAPTPAPAPSSQTDFWTNVSVTPATTPDGAAILLQGRF